MDISCILLTWNSEPYIEKCVTSLIASLNATKLTYEIFIVDNGSQDKTVSLLQSFQKSYPEHLFPIYLEKNTGTTYSRNLALQQARGDYLCIMDSDVEVFDGVFEQLIQALKDHNQAGLVAPKLVYPSGHLQKSTDVFPTVMTKFVRYFFLKLIEKREHASQTETTQQEFIREVDYAISAMWLFKRDVLDAVGLLDEKIFYAPEDVDYCLRIWKAGYKIFYVPYVSCIHHTQEISRGFRINKALINHILGLGYYFKKHKYFFRKPKISR